MTGRLIEITKEQVRWGEELKGMEAYIIERLVKKRDSYRSGIFGGTMRLPNVDQSINKDDLGEIIVEYFMGQLGFEESGGVHLRRSSTFSFRKPNRQIFVLVERGSKSNAYCVTAHECGLYRATKEKVKDNPGVPLPSSKKEKVANPVVVE